MFQLESHAWDSNISVVCFSTSWMWCSCTELPPTKDFSWYILVLCTVFTNYQTYISVLYWFVDLKKYFRVNYCFCDKIIQHLNITSGSRPLWARSKFGLWYAALGVVKMLHTDNKQQIRKWIQSPSKRRSYVTPVCAAQFSTDEGISSHQNSA